MDYILPMLLLFVGLAIGVTAAWLVLKTKGQHAYDRGKADAEGERSALADPEKESRPFSKWGPLVRTGLAAIPYAGGAMATAWSEWDTKRRFDRVGQSIGEICIALEAVRERFDPERIGEPEMQILEAVLNRVQSEHRERKRCRFAKLVASAWTEERDQPFEERMRFVRALDELDELHVRILAYLAEQKDADKTPEYAEIGEVAGVPEDERDQHLLPALNTLASSYGFIRRAWGMSSGEGSILFSKNLSPEGIARKCEHLITDVGIRFLRAISLSDEV